MTRGGCWSKLHGAGAGKHGDLHSARVGLRDRVVRGVLGWTADGERSLADPLRWPSWFTCPSEVSGNLIDSFDAPETPNGNMGDSLTISLNGPVMARAARDRGALELEIALPTTP